MSSLMAIAYQLAEADGSQPFTFGSRVAISSRNSSRVIPGAFFGSTASAVLCTMA